MSTANADHAPPGRGGRGAEDHPSGPAANDATHPAPPPTEGTAAG